MYLIKHGQQPGKQLTTAQRSHSKFAEEPVIMGKVFRKALKEMKLSDEQFENNKVALNWLVKAGSITVSKMGAEAVSQAPVEVPAPVEPLKESAPVAEVAAPLRGVEELVKVTEEVGGYDKELAPAPIPDPKPSAPKAEAQKHEPKKKHRKE